jgi:uncharacterized protein YwqG
MLKTRSEIISKAQAVGLSRVLAKLDELIENSIRLYPAHVDEAQIPLGSSKIGGRPDLPRSLSWPSWESGPMSFIAQVRLPEVKPYDVEGVLPTRGLLYFFYDCEQTAWGYLPKHGDGCKVFYFDGPDTHLVRTAFPSELPKGSRFSSCALRPSSEATLAPVDSVDFLTEDLDLTPEERESYYDLLGEVEVSSGPETAHRLLGHPDQIQNDMQGKCQLASNGIDVGGPEGYRDPRVPSLRLGAKDWRLLFQVDSEKDAQMMWGDCGRVYFWIKSKDLERHDFKRVWPVLQCG